MTCLIGYTGFVGSNLVAQRKYDVLINSKNIDTIQGKEFDVVVCAGVSAVKWKANKNPEEDLTGINRLLDVLKTIKTKTFILISTIDVYPLKNIMVDEDYDCHLEKNDTYGTNRLMVEDFCKNHFDDCTIIRLPALFGKGLKKNVIFDLLNNNCLEMIKPEASFQYYCLKHLSDDIELVRAHGIKCINLFTEPISTAEIISRYFPNLNIENRSSPNLVSYNIYTKYSYIKNLPGNYLYSKFDIFEDLKDFIETYNND